MSKHTSAKVRHNGSELTVQQHETDSPVIPVAQLQQLNEFRPDAVDWVIHQTQVEADHRRTESKRINTLIFTERLIGQICALAIGLSGIGVGGYVALKGQPWAGATIASIAITGLAVVFLKGTKATG